ncbi:hypothetical protein [Methylocaldum sp.]|uniref:hypothetical protein n=1 Tax=Methylocaldum sp. TaxID=1969727 RepID=UPI002D3E6F5B|nr:hypothetical protein [Methylocaldum sp.]HYE35438.1 hypothetical protein [Methylocaldum sp.]
MSVPLVRFAEPLTKALETKYQAECIIAALLHNPRRRIELDFAGITYVSRAFGDAFFRLAECELPETWLVPRHYDHPCPCLVHRLVSRLKQLREETWIRGCERFITGSDVQVPGKSW